MALHKISKFEDLYESFGYLPRDSDGYRHAQKKSDIHNVFSADWRYGEF